MSSLCLSSGSHERLGRRLPELNSVGVRKLPHVPEAMSGSGGLDVGSRVGLCQRTANHPKPFYPNVSVQRDAVNGHYRGLQRSHGSSEGESQVLAVHRDAGCFLDHGIELANEFEMAIIGPRTRFYCVWADQDVVQSGVQCFLHVRRLLREVICYRASGCRFGDVPQDPLQIMHLLSGGAKKAQALLDVRPPSRAHCRPEADQRVCVWIRFDHTAGHNSPQKDNSIASDLLTVYGVAMIVGHWHDQAAGIRAEIAFIFASERSLQHQAALRQSQRRAMNGC